MAMITEQEKNNILQGFENIQISIQRMLSMLDKYRSKKEVLLSIINTRFPNNSFETSVDNFLSQENFLQSLHKSFLVVPDLEDVSNQYKTFLQTEITQFNPQSMHLLQDSCCTQLDRFINRQEVFQFDITPQDNNVIIWIHQLPDQYLQYIDMLSKMQCNLHIFNQIKHIDGSIVMIGANGSGKSTFARQLNGKLSNNIVILSAQHLLYYTKRKTISATGDELDKVRAFQRNSKLSSNTDFQQLITSDMNGLINALVSQHTDCTFTYYETDRKEISFLSKTIELWNKIIEHRSLINSRTGLFVTGQNIKPYDFNQLSDGEKAVFYYIGHVLLAPHNSYIIVDEPENHLHLTICNKLWDELEKNRPDCKFIYLTHNLNFATTRSDSTILWNKKFIPPNNWDFEILPEDEIIPEILIMEIVGSRKNICFCESQNRSKLDYKLYYILFPEYTIIPAAGHRNVIDYVNAYNSTSTFVTQAIGIIDGDHHLPEQIEKWRQQKIYTLPINEIENILCDDVILQKAVDRFCADENAFDKFHNEFWKLLNDEKEHQATAYVNEYINNLFKNNFLHEKQNVESLISELQDVTSAEQIRNIYESTLKKLEEFIVNKKYNEALSFVNFKGRLTKDLTKKTIVDKYENRILDLIKKDSDLQKYIVDTYFQNFHNL